MEIKTKRKITIRSCEEKKALCEQWKSSGKSKSTFCKEHNISIGTFYEWCNKWWPSSKEPNLVPIKVINKAARFSEAQVDRTEIELVLSSNTLVRLKLPHKNLVTFIQELSHAITTVR